MRFAIIVILVMALSVLAIYLRGVYLQRQNREADRAGLTVRNFREEFAGSGYRDAAIDYAYLILVGISGHHIFRHEAIKAVGITPEELLFEAEWFWLKLNGTKKIPDHYFEALSLVSAEDYVRFLSELEGAKNSIDNNLMDEPH